MAPVLARYKEVVRIEAPGTLDGGDVLIVDKHGFIGVSERTNEEGAAQLGRILAAHGYTWAAVPVGDGLHLKSSANYLGPNTVLTSEALAADGMFTVHREFLIDPDEVYAANVLWINGTVLVPAGYPRTTWQIERLGLPVMALDVSEMRKMDGGLTCLSIRF